MLISIKKDKTIKKLGKIALILLALIVLPPLTVYLAWYIPGVSSYFAKKLTASIGKSYNVDFKVDHLYYVPPTSLTFKGIALNNAVGDSIVSIPKLTVSFSDFSLENNSLTISRIGLTNAHFFLKKDSSGLNIQPILDSLASSSTSDTSKLSWKFQIASIKFKNCNFSYSNHLMPDTVTRLNPAHLGLTNVNLTIDSILQYTDSIGFKIKQLAFTDKCGLTVTRARAEVGIGKRGVSLNDVWLSTPYSAVAADSLKLVYDSTDDFSDFYNKVYLSGNFKNITIAPNDLQFLTPLLPALNNALSLSGSISGKVASLKGRNIKFQYGVNTGVEANFDVDGLPKLNETFVFLDILNLQTDINDIEKLFGKDSISPLKLPDNLKKLGIVSYQGKFTGFFNDLVAYGKFKTSLGEITTDLGFKLKEDNSIVYSGAFKSPQLNVGEFIGNTNNFTKLALNLSVNGGWAPSGNYLAYLEGNIDSISYDNYKYHRLNVKGLFTQRQFDGEIEVDDPNGYLNFNGRVDLSAKTPIFNFVTIVRDVKLDKLNLAPKLKNSNLSFKVESNFEGDNPDNLVGQIKISNASLLTDIDNIRINNFVVKSLIEGNSKKLTCSSNILDGEVVGQFYYRDFVSVLQRQINTYFPSLFTAQAKLPIQSNTNFSFRINTKKLSPFVNIFAPTYQMSDTTFLYGSVNSAKKDMNMTLEVDKFVGPSLEVDKLFLRLKTNTQKALLNVKTRQITVGSGLTFSNFTINNQAATDTLTTNVFWNNWGEKVNSGAISIASTFNMRQTGELEVFASVLPSRLTVENSVWNFSKALISILPQGVLVAGFTAQNQQQKLEINGSVYKAGGDELKCRFDSINLDYLTNLVAISQARFGGILQGDLNIKDLYSNPYFISQLSINDFKFNGDSLGVVNLKSQWNPEKSGIALELLLTHNNSTPLDGKGWIYPKENRMDVDVKLDSFKLGFLDYYLGDILQKLHGSASGLVKIGGQISGPELTARVHANDLHFDIDLLKTHYVVSDSVFLTPHQMYFNNMTVVDEKNSKAKFWGSIYHTHFWDFIFDLHVTGRNMFVLNTKSDDNPLYYGTIFADGGLDIKGTTDNLYMDINGKTLPGTKFFIPLQESAEAEVSKFIRFTTLAKNKKFSSDDYQVNVSGLNLSLNAEITPDALTQIIFNSKSGDILQSKGNGNIQVKMDKDGKIGFYGSYTILDGDYLFTLSNLMNKKFKINEGGTVTWNGDPYNAAINIKAIYKVRASLSDLYGTSADATTTAASRRIPINCNLLLTDNLQLPTIKFDIETPSLENQNKNLIREYITTEDEMNRQVISLLALNRFYTPEYLKSTSTSSSLTTEKSALATTTSELLTSQLSLWLSQISNDVDVGVIYRPRDEITRAEMAISLSTQMFDNRLTLNSTTGYARGQESTSSLIGDFDVDVKLNKKGSLSLKAYTKTNDNLIYDSSPTTQGVGVTYREEFHSFKDLLVKYWDFLFGKRKEDEEDVVR